MEKPALCTKYFVRVRETKDLLPLPYPVRRSKEPLTPGKRLCMYIRYTRQKRDEHLLGDVGHPTSRSLAKPFYFISITLACCSLQICLLFPRDFLHGLFNQGQGLAWGGEPQRPQKKKKNWRRSLPRLGGTFLAFSHLMVTHAWCRHETRDRLMRTFLI